MGKSLRSITIRLTTLSLLCWIILVSILYILYITDNTDKMLDFFVSGNIFILTLNLFLISNKMNERLMKYGSIIVLFTSVFETLGIIFLPTRLSDILIFGFRLFHISAASIMLRGLHKTMYHEITQKKSIEKNNKRLTVFSKFGRMVYFEYNIKLESFIIELSDGFANKYNLKYNKIVASLEEATEYIHEEDVNYFYKLLHKINKNEEVKAKLRVKYPSMKKYIYILTRTFIQNDKVVIGTAFDFDDYENIKENLKNTQNQLIIKEKEQQLLLDNTSDYILRLSPNGDILNASKSCNNLIADSSLGKRLLQEMNPKSDAGYVMKMEDSKHEQWISWRSDYIYRDNTIKYIIIVGHDVTNIKKLNIELQNENTLDSLTGLLNRRGIYKEIEKLDNKVKVAAFYIDVDNFKDINDYYGHLIGDKVLELLANRLKEFNKLGCLVSRLSGDEFLVLCQEKSEIDTIKRRILDFVESTYTIDEFVINIEISVGYSIYPDDSNDIRNLIPYSDIAMYECKRNSRGSIIHFDESMLNRLEHKVLMSNEIKEAIIKDYFEIYFQDIIEAKTNKSRYVESLARWNSSVRGIVSPGVFLPVAVELGVMLKLDLYLINKSIIEFSMLKEKGIYFDTTILTINVSPQALLNRDFPYKLNEFILNSKLSHKEICIELNEETFINNIELCNKQIKRIKQYGVKIALDDFGSKYSSLTVINEINFDIIKVDRGFIQTIDDPSTISILNMVYDISKHKNIEVIIEGVETIDHVEKIKKLGFELLQGYYYSIPSPIK